MDSGKNLEKKSAVFLAGVGSRNILGYAERIDERF